MLLYCGKNGDEMTQNNNYTKRLSYQRWKKMRSHLDELQGFFQESLGALKNMIETGMDEERGRQRKNDKET